MASPPGGFVWSRRVTLVAGLLCMLFFLVVYQVLNIAQTHGDLSNNAEKCWKMPESESFSIDRRAEKTQARRVATSTSELDSFFSGCLLFMDDNHFLIEWLAYHFHVLPLRRLIVGVDPRSTTQPYNVLNRYSKRGLMDITVWQEQDFMPPHLIHLHHVINETDPEQLTYLYVERQKHFNVRCMATLHHEGAHWTSMVDVDEFILPNMYAQDRFQLANQKSIGNKTVLELIQQNPDIHPMFRTGCISLHRLQFGPYQGPGDNFEMGLPRGLDANDFLTIRYRYHAGRTNSKFNKVAKCLIDLSQVESGAWFLPEENDAHRPLKSKCKLNYMRIENKVSPLVAHHYAGSWQQWSYRQDSREKRKRVNFDKMLFNDHTNMDSTICWWLPSFFQTIGPGVAKELLTGVGKLNTLAP